MSRLDWKVIRPWRRRFIGSFPAELPKELFRLAALEDHERFYSDDLSWLNRLRDRAGLDSSVELDALIASGLERAFQTVRTEPTRTYHACRPTDVGTYLRRGLEPSCPENLKAEALRLFAQLGVTEAEIDDAYASRDLGSESGVSFLSLDDRDYAEDCGHYLIYGSERLQAVAACLHRVYGDHPRALLRERGIPTVFEIDLPVGLVDQDTREELVRNMLATLFTVSGRLPREGPSIDFTFTIREPIPASQIRSHIHPAAVRNPDSVSWYRSPSTQCEYCRE